VSGLALLGWIAAGACSGVAALLQARLIRHASLVADAGHELRGPLCAARLGLHALADEDRAAAVDLELRRATLALDDLAAACHGRRAGERAVLVDVGALLDDAAEAWRPLARAFGAELAVEPLRGRALVRADPVRLAQACGNLVANAVEHGASPVHVRGRVLAGHVRVEVHDAGPGLPGLVRELVDGSGRGRAWRCLPGPVQQLVDGSGRGRAGGRGRGGPPRAPAAPRGRGLAIAAGIAERHGGRLAAGPSAAGACLMLELPCADGSPPLAR
jgi:signal transduction histidine kinase